MNHPRNNQINHLILNSRRAPRIYQSNNLVVNGRDIPRLVGEFWTPKQRQASSIHEISYRACFKPQLPRYFIKLLTRPGELVYDPFAGRGTTAIEAGLLGRRVINNDINPLSEILSRPRLTPPALEEVKRRLGHC
ncbi:MAG TPA: site-specific DNA-methyltransferase, partial [Firmicutes bacterium]|nr:site-specific DNA-methyltransferase [Bacillota bacterium]